MPGQHTDKAIRRWMYGEKLENFLRQDSSSILGAIPGTPASRLRAFACTNRRRSHETRARVVFDLYPHAPNGVLMGDPYRPLSGREVRGEPDWHCVDCNEDFNDENGF